MEGLKQSIQEMSTLFHTRMAQFQDELSSKASPKVQLTPSALAADFVAFKSFIMVALKNLQAQLELLAQEVDRQEMRSRRKIILLHGVPETKDEVCAASAVKIFSEKLKQSDVSEGAISRCHRLGRPSTDRPRPLLVRFRELSVRENVWSAKTGLKGTGVTMSEFLTVVRHRLFMTARQRHGVTRCWTRDGTIFVLGPDSARHRVLSLDELDKIPSPDSAPETVPEAANTNDRNRRKRIPSKK